MPHLSVCHLQSALNFLLNHFLFSFLLKLSLHWVVEGSGISIGLLATLGLSVEYPIDSSLILDSPTALPLLVQRGCCQC